MPCAASLFGLPSKSAQGASHPVTVVLDSSLTTASPYTKIAFHAQSTTESIIVSIADVLKFVKARKIESKVVDFSELKSKTLAASSVGSAVLKSVAGYVPTTTKSAAKIEDAELIGITVHKDGDFPEWYQQVLKKGDMLDYYDVSGCYILKPWSYTVWEKIQRESSLRSGPTSLAYHEFAPSLIITDRILRR